MKKNSLESETILRVEDLSLAYGDYQVLQKVSFSAKKGECMVLMGGSGCGKSTLLKSMVGLLSPECGKILVDSIDLWSVSQEEKTTILKKYGVLFQSHPIFLLKSLGHPRKRIVYLNELHFE